MKSKKEFVHESFFKINGDKAIRTYKRGKKLGKGGFAKVYDLLSLDTNKLSAAKFIPKKSLSKPHEYVKIMKEIKIHRSMHHQNILAFEHYFEDSSHIYMLLERCENGSLNDVIKRRKRLTEIEIQCILFQLISGLIYLHSN